MMLVSFQSAGPVQPIKIGGAELFPPGVPVTPDDAKKPGAAAQLIVLPAQDNSGARLFTQNYSQNKMASGLTLDGTAEGIAAYEAQLGIGSAAHELDLLV